MKQSLSFTLSVALLLIALPAYSQTQTQDLYQIEVIVFERLQPAGTANSELWPKSIELSYPENLATLIDPKKEAEAKAAQASSRASSFSLSEDFLNSIKADQSAEAEAEAEAADSAPQQAASEPLPADEIEKSSVRLNTFLAPEFKRLTDKKNALNRRGDYRVLFHETWLQSLKSPTKSPALPIAAGNTFGEHQELEGYIKVSLNRYLHFETNLWFTEFVANFGQPREHWPQLPDPFADATQESTEAWQEQSASFSGPYIPGMGMEADIASGNEWAAAEVDPYASLLEAPYLINSIAVMQLKRRMRSGELHYLDHPKLGVLVKIDPAKPEQ